MGGRVFSEKNPVFHPSEGLLTFHNFWMTIVTIYNNITHKSDSMIDIRASKKKIKKSSDSNLISRIWIDLSILIDENMINDGFFHWSTRRTCIQTIEENCLLKWMGVFFFFTFLYI